LCVTSHVVARSNNTLGRSVPVQQEIAVATVAEMTAVKNGRWTKDGLLAGKV